MFFKIIALLGVIHISSLQAMDRESVHDEFTLVVGNAGTMGGFHNTHMLKFHQGTIKESQEFSPNSPTHAFIKTDVKPHKSMTFIFYPKSWGYVTLDKEPHFIEIYSQVSPLLGINKNDSLFQMLTKLELSKAKKKQKQSKKEYDIAHIRADFITCDVESQLKKLNMDLNNLGTIYGELIPAYFLPPIVEKASKILKSGKKFEATFSIDRLYDDEWNIGLATNYPFSILLHPLYVEKLFSENIQQYIKKVVLDKKFLQEDFKKEFNFDEKKGVEQITLCQIMSFLEALALYRMNTSYTKESLTKVLEVESSNLKKAWVTETKKKPSDRLTDVFDTESVREKYVTTSIISWSQAFMIKKYFPIHFSNFMEKCGFKDYSIEFKNDPYTGRHLIPTLTAFKK